MRDVTVNHYYKGGIVIHVGKVSQRGDYKTLQLSDAEAAVLMEKLKRKLK